MAKVHGKGTFCLPSIGDDKHVTKHCPVISADEQTSPSPSSFSISYQKYLHSAECCSEW